MASIVCLVKFYLIQLSFAKVDKIKILYRYWKKTTFTALWFGTQIEGTGSERRPCS